LSDDHQSPRNCPRRTGRLVRCTRKAAPDVLPETMTTAMIVSLEPGIGRPDPRLTIMKQGPRICRRPPAVSPPDPGSRPPHGGAPTWVLAASNFLVDGVAVRKPAYRLIDGATVDVLPPLAGGQPTLSMIMSVDSGHIPKPTLTILKQPPAARRPRPDVAGGCRPCRSSPTLSAAAPG